MIGKQLAVVLLAARGTVYVRVQASFPAIASIRVQAVRHDLIRMAKDYGNVETGLYFNLETNTLEAQPEVLQAPVEASEAVDDSILALLAAVDPKEQLVEVYAWNGPKTQNPWDAAMATPF